MKELKCPKFGNVFQVDEADYASIVSQVKNAEFEAEIQHRLAEMNKRLTAEQQLATSRTEQSFQAQLSKKDLLLGEKDTEIERLKMQLQNIESKKQSELTLALAEKDQTIAQLNSTIAQNDDKRHLAVMEERNKAQQSMQKKETELSQLRTALELEKREAQIHESALVKRHEDELRMKQEQVDYYKDWYNVAVREALSVLNISDNYQDLAFFMNPRITVPQAKRAIKLLSDLGLIEKENGFWRSVNKTITSGREIPAFIVHKFQKEMMDLGKAAVDNYSTERRNVSCTTMSVSPQGLERIIHKIDAFRKEVVDIVRSDDGESMIYELNIQFFPLSKELEIPAGRSDAVRSQGGIDEN